MVDSGLHIDNYNNDFLIIKSEDRSLLVDSGKSIYESKFDFVEEVIVAEAEICIKLNDQFTESRLSELDNLKSKVKKESRSFSLPVYFAESEDWRAIEKQTGNSKKDVITKLCESVFTVAMFGFLPGFVYLDGLDPELHVPRKTTPSKYVKANSIAIGGKYLGVYSIDSPGGWYVIGQVPTSVLKLDSLPPVSFNIGDSIQLESIGQKQYDRIIADGISFTAYNS